MTTDAPVLASYANGNYAVTLHADGTKVRETADDAFRPEFPENLDVKVTNACSEGCPWCHECSTPEGPHGDLDAAFLSGLAAGTELAIGGGNALLHPGLTPFLERMAARGVVCNLTVSQRAFLETLPRLADLSCRGLIHGLGVSLADPEEPGFLASLDAFPHAVLHTIHGITDYPALVEACKAAGVRLRVLVLGYKDVGRGIAYRSSAVDARMTESYGFIHRLRAACEVLSFDNLAITQIDARRLCTSEEWAESYMGDDATFTMYADLVRGEYAPNSTAPRSERRPLADGVREMFRDVRGRRS